MTHTRQLSADTDENEHTDSHGLRTQIFLNFDPCFSVFIRVLFIF